MSACPSSIPELAVRLLRDLIRIDTTNPPGIVRVDMKTGAIETFATVPYGIDNFIFDAQDRLFVSLLGEGAIAEAKPDGALRMLGPTGLVMPGGVAVVARCLRGRHVLRVAQIELPWPPPLLEHEMHPSEPVRREPREVTIPRDPGAPLRNRQRGVLCVGNHLAGGAGRPAELGHVREMPHPRRREATARMAGQLLDRGDGNGQGSRVGVDTWAGYDPEEPHGHQHAEGERLRTIDCPSQPVRIRLMPRLVLPVGVDEDVDVGHQHRQRSPSRSWSSAAAAKSAGSWLTRRSGRPKVTIVNGAATTGGSRRASRRASFTTSLNVWSRSTARRFARRTRASSRISVVRIQVIIRMRGQSSTSGSRAAAPRGRAAAPRGRAAAPRGRGTCSRQPVPAARARSESAHVRWRAEAWLPTGASVAASWFDRTRRRC